MSVAERKAMDLEIQRQLAEYDQKHVAELDAMILWVLYNDFNFTPEQLRQYYDIFRASVHGLINRYELEKSDDIWLCTRMLKEIGVDIEAWHKEDLT